MLRLGPLGGPESARLLGALVGDHRAGDDPGSIGLLAELCDRLPLALGGAAARLSSKPHWTVGHLVARLQDPLHRLDELSAGDPRIHAAFDASYRILNPAAAMMYRRLGLLGPHDLSPDVGAALLDASAIDAENLMEQLVDAGLLDAVRPDGSGAVRYRLPALLALHALECADADEVPAKLAAAHRRLAAAQAILRGAGCAIADQCHQCMLRDEQLIGDRTSSRSAAEHFEL